VHLRSEQKKWLPLKVAPWILVLQVILAGSFAENKSTGGATPISTVSAEIIVTSESKSKESLSSS